MRSQLILDTTTGIYCDSGTWVVRAAIAIESTAAWIDGHHSPHPHPLSISPSPIFHDIDSFDRIKSHYISFRGFPYWY